MRQFRAVLFDLYDTLVWLDLEESDRWRASFSRRMGAPIESFLRVWRRSVHDRMLGKGGDLATHIASTVCELGITPNPELVGDLVQIERRRLENSVKPYPNTFPVLRRLAASGMRLALLSNASDGAAIPITHLGIDRFFHQQILSHEVGLLKPDPAIYHLACQRLNVVPGDTAFVADGGFGELDAAHRLGIFAVLIDQPNQSKDYGSSTSYDVKIHNIKEVEALLGLPVSVNSE